jgi:SRSO17 transposase
MAAGVAPKIAVADAGYGVDTAFRDHLSERGLQYVCVFRTKVTAVSGAT